MNWCFRFPVDEIRRLEWTKTIRNARLDEYWESSNRSVICSMHFDEQYFYVTKGGITRLRKDALPTKNLAFGTRKSEVCVEILEPSTSENVREQQSPVSSNSGIGDVLVDDSIFDTPRKIKLKSQMNRKQIICERYVRKIKTLQQKCRRVVKQNESLKAILRNLKKSRYVNDDVYDLLSKNIVAADIFNNVYKKNLLKKKKPVYTAKIKKFCLTLNFLSPSAYKYVRATFDTCLPHPKTLSKWYSNVNAEPGFSDESFRALKDKAASSEHKIHCALIVDEMSLRQQSLWDGKKNCGYVDMGTGTTDECKTLASEAYVFLLNAINDNFKLPLGYFLVHGLNAEQKVNLIKLCLIKCHDAGVKVVSLTFDGHATNLTAMKLLGCEIDVNKEIKTTFEHPVDKSDVSVFLDPVHMFKLVRNNWESKKIIMDSNNEDIEWGLLCELNKLQENEGLHLANKLTRRHIMFRNNIMKVKLASQVLSNSVATALQFCREDAKLNAFKNAHATEVFIRNMNNLFDIFNSRNLKQFDFKQPLNSRNKEMVFTFLEAMKEYIHGLKIKNVTKRKIIQDGKKKFVILKNYKPILECACKTGFLGILIGIESLKSLYTRLVEGDNLLSFIPTYKCSQDHIEIFFGMIRMHGSHNDNPNCKQFKGIYRKLLCHLEIKASDTGNCIPLENIGILNCSSAIKAINFSASVQRFDEIEDDTSISKLLDLELPQLQDLSKYIVGYISGSVVHYLTKAIKCQFCVEAMLATDVFWFHKLIGLKQRGGLCYPSQCVYEICCICETHIRRIVREDFIIISNSQRLSIVLSIFKAFIGKDNLFPLDNNHVNGLSHRNSLLRAVIEKYLDIRLHYVSKCKTLQISSYSKRQYFKKLTQQKGT